MSSTPIKPKKSTTFPNPSAATYHQHLNKPTPPKYSHNFNSYSKPMQGVGVRGK